jgi:hypothetical protein
MSDQDIIVDRLPTGEYMAYYRGLPITIKLRTRREATIAAAAARHVLHYLGRYLGKIDIRDDCHLALDIDENRMEDVWDDPR